MKRGCYESESRVKAKPLYSAAASKIGQRQTLENHLDTIQVEIRISVLND